MSSIFLNLDDLPQSYHDAVVAIGNFDGVHLGHQELIKTCVHYAKEHKKPSGVITFNPHPVAFFSGDSHVTLQSFDDKMQSILALNVNFVITINFDKSIANLTHEEFLHDFLLKKLQVNHIITGEDFRFGLKRRGDTQYLANSMASLGLSYTQINSIKWQDYVVSSTQIKDFIKAGRVLIASRLLGKYYTVKAPYNVLLPAKGAYLARVHDTHVIADVLSDYEIEFIYLHPEDELKISALPEQQIEFMCLLRIKDLRELSGADLEKQKMIDIRNAHYSINHPQLLDNAF